MIPIVPAFAAGPISIAGKSTLTYEKQERVELNDILGHQLSSAVAKGTNQNTGQSNFMNGAEVTDVESSDLVQGNGPQQGFVNFSNAGEGSVAVQWNGNAKTTMAGDKQNTTFNGQWHFVRGTGNYQDIKGQGTYEGYAPSPTSLVVDFKGEYTAPGAGAEGRSTR
jgi:hypothetical protein